MDNEFRQKSGVSLFHLGTIFRRRYTVNSLIKISSVSMDRQGCVILALEVVPTI